MVVNYTKKAVGGSVVVFVMTIVSSFLAYFIRVILAKQLSLEQFGLFYAVFTFITFLGIFKDVGLRNAAVKFIAEFNAKRHFSKLKTVLLTALLGQFVLVVVFMAVILLFSRFLSVHYFQAPDSFLLLIAASFYFVSSFLFMNLRSVLKGFQDMFWFSIVDPARLVFVIIFIFAYLKLGFGVLSPIIAYVTADFMGLLLMSVPAFKYRFVLSHKVRDVKKTVKELFAFGLPVMFTGIGDKVISYIDVLLLTYFSSLSIVGIYNLILPTSLIFLIFGGSIATVVYPMVSELWAKKDKLRISAGLKSIYSYLFLLIVPLILLVFVFADPLINLFFGVEFLPGVLAFRILLVGVIFFVLAKINFAAISGIGRPGVVTKIILLMALLNLVLNLFLIPSFGMDGAAFATALTYTCAFFLSVFALVKFVPVIVPWIAWFKIFFVSIVVSLMVHYLRGIILINPYLELVVLSFVAGVVYLLLVFVLRIVVWGEIVGVFRRVLY